MAEKTVHEAVWTLIQSFQETNQAIVAFTQLAIRQT
jgi:hypothetical protein